MAYPKAGYPIGAESIHNWTQRYAHLPTALELPAIVQAAIKAAHLRHHNEGTGAGEEAESLRARFPEDLTKGW